MTDETITGMYEFFEAVEEVVKAAPAEKREALAAVIDAYADSFPDEYYWATGAQAPALLYNMMLSIDLSCRSKPKSDSDE